MENLGKHSKNCDTEIAKNFCTKYILAYAKDQEELDYYEIKLIKLGRQLQEFNHQCLNGNGGGQLNFLQNTHCWTIEQREKMQKHFDDPDSYYKNHHQQVLQALEKAHIATKGRKYTLEQRANLSKALKGCKKKDSTIEKMKLAQQCEKKSSS